MHALICDDDEFVLLTLEHALRRFGYQVTAVNNAAAAIDVLRSTNIRLLLTDWEMPGMTGVELCRSIRQEDISGYVYLIMLTGHDMPKHRLEALTAGADDFLVKPFNRDELVASLKAAERILSLETRDLAMFAMAKLAESRDPDTGAHVERVQAYARALAVQLATTEKYAPIIDSEYVRLIYQTSPLHDIGKVGIPDTILLKPGKLDPAEYDAMKTHVLIGARTLEAAVQRFPNARFLQMARDIAASHHERFDGKGYPASLSGEQIPLSGRIVALADVYDALMSRRVYKAAMPYEQTRKIIIEERGRHFDPDVVDAFIAVEQQFLDIRSRLTDEPPESALQLSPLPNSVPYADVIKTPPKVLVVEDDTIVRDGIVHTLTAVGYTVFQSGNADDARAIALEHSPQIIVSDWVMPGMSGVELCTQLRQSLADNAPHFIMLTMHSAAASLLEAYDGGVDDFLAKPFNAGELIARVRVGVRAVEARDRLRLKTEGSLRLTAQLAQLNTQLEKVAITDELTQLFNRRQAMVRLDEQWALATRYGQPMTVMLVDVDHFKSINDTHGHAAGDIVLQAIATILREQSRATDVVCRVGGEEFLVLFPAESPEQAAVYAERCRAAVEFRLFAAFGTTLRASISIGLATRSTGMAGSSDLLRAADQALYTAKHHGRNCIRIAGVPIDGAMKLAG